MAQILRHVNSSPPLDRHFPGTVQHTSTTRPASSGPLKSASFIGSPGLEDGPTWNLRPTQTRTGSPPQRPTWNHEELTHPFDPSSGFWGSVRRGIGPHGEGMAMAFRSHQAISLKVQVSGCLGPPYPSAPPPQSAPTPPAGPGRPWRTQAARPRRRCSAGHGPPVKNSGAGGIQKANQHRNRLSGCFVDALG